MHTSVRIAFATLLFFPVFALADTADLKAQVESLLQQVTTLNAQLTSGAVLGASTACPNLTRSLSRGSRGSDVVALQTFLISQNLLASGNATGYFGNLTFAAVVNFQKSQGISALGLVGPLTRAAIAKKCLTAAEFQIFSASPGAGVPLSATFYSDSSYCTKIDCEAAYSIDFGDGQTAMIPRLFKGCDASRAPSGDCSIWLTDHTYAKPGTYTATLKGFTNSCVQGADCGGPLIGTARVTVQ